MEENDEVSSITCAVCSTDIDIDSVITTEYDDTVCADCAMSCQRCGEMYSINDDAYIVDGDMWCESCTERNANYCDGCDEYTTDGVSTPLDGNCRYCDNCIGNYSWCDDCDGYYINGCEEDHDDARTIHDYNYRPDVIFHGAGGEKLFFGIEVELEVNRNNGNLSEVAEYANRLEPMGLAYLKSDGSLSYGFEVVSHPMTHDFWKNNAGEFFTTMEELRSVHKVKSWDTQTCGFHIHISKAGFSGGAHMHRFLNLVYSNQPFYEALAGRQSSRWAKFDDVSASGYDYDADGNRVYKKSPRRFKDKINNGRNTDRYAAINTQNPHTFEMRIFRGSVKGDLIKAHLDLAHASVEYTRVMSVSEVRDGALSPDNFIAYIKDNGALYPELVARLAKVWDPTLSASRQEVSI